MDRLFALATRLHTSLFPSADPMTASLRRSDDRFSPRALALPAFVLPALALLMVAAPVAVPQVVHAQTVSEITDSNGNVVISAQEGWVGINRDFSIGAEAFGVRAEAGADTYGGMYMETTNTGGDPFYGYATDGSFDMWTYYDGSEGNWHVYNGSERLTVRDDGFVGVNRETQITPNEQFGVQAPAGAGVFGGMYVETAASDGLPFYGYAADNTVQAYTYYDPATSEWYLNNGGDVVTVDASGDMTIDGTLTENSDRRLKTSIEPLGSVLDALADIRPVRYRKESTGNAQDEDIGLVAQEVQKEFPELVHEGSDGYLSLSYSKFSSVLLKGLQEQQSQIEELKAENKRIKERLSALEAQTTAPAAASLMGAWELALLLGIGGLAGGVLWRRSA